jgi:hypothetical protein
MSAGDESDQKPCIAVAPFPALPQASTLHVSVYAPRQRAEWLAKIAQPGVRVRAERLYQQLDLLQPVRLEHAARCWKATSILP